MSRANSGFFACVGDVQPVSWSNAKGACGTFMKATAYLVGGHPSITITGVVLGKKTIENFPDAVAPDTHVLRTGEGFELIFPQKNMSEPGCTPVAGQVVYIPSYYAQWNMFHPKGAPDKIVTRVSVNARSWQFVRVDGVIQTQKPGTTFLSERDVHSMGSRVVMLGTPEASDIANAVTTVPPETSCIISGRGYKLDGKIEVDATFPRKGVDQYGMNFGADYDGVRVHVTMRKGMETDFGLVTPKEGVAVNPAALEAYKNICTAFFGSGPLIAGELDAQRTYENGLCSNQQLVVRKASFLVPTAKEFESVGVPVSNAVALEALAHLPADGPDPAPGAGSPMRVIYGKHPNNAAAIAEAPLCFLVPRVAGVRTMVAKNGMSVLLRKVNDLPMEKRLGALLAEIEEASMGYRDEKFMVLCVRPSDTGSKLVNLVTKYFQMQKSMESSAPDAAAPAPDTTDPAPGAPVAEAPPVVAPVSAAETAAVSAPAAESAPATAAKRPRADAPAVSKRSASAI